MANRLSLQSRMEIRILLGLPALVLIARGSARLVAPGLLAIGAGLLLVLPAHAAAPRGNDGSVILRMCKGADKVKTLSVMCHSYLDGYLDAAHHYGKGKAAFCLGDGGRQKVPGALVEWIDAHPESLTQPAGEVLQKALAQRFPCTHGK
jgi:hypothetical protein